MSLVNDMLRDLEARRAAPNERLQLDGLQAVDEAGAARRERTERIRRGLVWLGAVILAGVLVGLMIGRLMNPGDSLLPITPPTAAAPVVSAPPAVPAPQVLDVLPQHDERGLVLQLLLDRSVTYQRTEESGAVSLRLPGVLLPGGKQQGRVQRAGRSLSWRVEPQGQDVQILLVGLGEGLDVRDRLEAAGDHWMLWIEVPLNAPVANNDAPLDIDNLPPAEAADTAEPTPPSWATAPVPAANTPAKSTPAPTPTAAPAPASVPSGPPQVRVAPYQPDALSLARQAVQDGDYPRAIRDLEALNRARPRDAEVIRLLARAYLSAGQQPRLLEWLPGQVQQMPNDSELRLLLARVQLQSGETHAAVETLEQHAPPLLQEPTYFALLAATYQQTGQWRESAALYRRLVELRPSQAAWQLGLGIALEQMDQSAEAVRHYHLALQGAGLDQGSRQFAVERAQALGGR